MRPSEVIRNKGLWRGTGQEETLLKSKEVKGNQEKQKKDITSLKREAIKWNSQEGCSKRRPGSTWKGKKSRIHQDLSSSRR